MNTPKQAKHKMKLGGYSSWINRTDEDKIAHIQRLKQGTINYQKRLKVALEMLAQYEKEHGPVDIT